jgi:hypothetical protein
MVTETPLPTRSVLLAKPAFVNLHRITRYEGRRI